MAKRLLGFFKSHTQSVGTQVAIIDPDKVATWLDRFSINSKLLKDLYSVFVTMLRCGKNQLNITEEMIESLGNEVPKFDAIIGSMGAQIKHEEEELKARKCRIAHMKQENDNLKRTLEKFRKETDWHTWEENEYEQIRLANVTKLQELRKERLDELEKRLQDINNHIENLVEKLHESSERLENIQILKETQMEDHKEEIQVLIRFWSETKTQRAKLLAVKPHESSKNMIQALSKDPTELRHLEEDDAHLKIKQELMDVQIHYELEEQEEIARRNHDLLAKVLQNEEYVFTLKARREGMSAAVIAAKWHDHMIKRPRDSYTSLSTNQKMLPYKEQESRIFDLRVL